MSLHEEAVEAHTVTESSAEETMVKTRHLGLRWALAMTLVYFVIQVAVGFSLSLLIGIYIGVSQRLTDAEEIAAVFQPYLLPICIAAVLMGGFVVLLMARHLLRAGEDERGMQVLGWGGAPLSSVVRAALCGIVLSGVYLFGLVPAFPPSPDQQWGMLAQAASAGGVALYLWALLAVLIAPPVEEFVFRGVLFAGLSSRLSVYVAALLVTLVFVVAHVSETLDYWPAWVGIGTLAIAAVTLRVRTRSLLPPIAAHAGYNLVLVIVTLLGYS